MSRTVKDETDAGGRLVRTTVLQKTFASGDIECFCFDDRDPGERARLDAEWDRIYRVEATDEERRRAGSALFDSDDAARTYPRDLLPDHRDRRGTWTITVTFEPEEDAG